MDLYDPEWEEGQARHELGRKPFGPITITVYESEAAKVRIDNAPFDEFVQILEGRLILTLDDGREFKFEEGDSLVVPKGFSDYWHMPENYRELIIIDTIPSGSEE